MHIDSNIGRLEYKKLDFDNKKELEEFSELKKKSLEEDISSNYFFMGVNEYDLNSFIKNRKNFFLLKFNNKVIGFVYIKRFKYIKINHNFEISDIYIDSYYQGNGLGNILIDIAEKEILNESRDLRLVNIFLKVAENNKKGISLYEKYGYKKTGEQKDFIQDNGIYSGLIYMVKSITNENL